MTKVENFVQYKVHELRQGMYWVSEALTELVHDFLHEPRFFRNLANKVLGKRATVSMVPQEIFSTIGPGGETTSVVFKNIPRPEIFELPGIVFDNKKKKK